MDEGRLNDPEPSCLWLNITPRTAPKGLTGEPSNTDSKESGEEASTPTTAPQTPSICSPADVIGRSVRQTDAIKIGCNSSSGNASGPATIVQSSETARQITGDATQQAFSFPRLGASYKPFPDVQIRDLPLPRTTSPASHLRSPSAFVASRCTETSSSKPQRKAPPELTQAPKLPERREGCSGACEASRQGTLEHTSDSVQAIDNNAAKSSVCVTTEDICLQHLLEQYRHRRAAFERNCSQRYTRIFEVSMQKRQATGLWRLAAGGQHIDQRQRCRLSPAQTRARKGHEGEGAELTASSSGEEAASRAAREVGETSGSCVEGDTHLNEGGLIRRTKGTGQRSFPYRQFHVHHFLPEPENKVGLLTHPTPAQFNKYPKARGVWFDPHRNLVRTCWKENGKAKTMGFPVNKFGLEEARTLAVEYHYYKCPTDPLPDDLLSLVPRKPPHAYGWC